MRVMTAMRSVYLFVFICFIVNTIAWCLPQLALAQNTYPPWMYNRSQAHDSHQGPDQSSAQREYYQNRSAMGRERDRLSLDWEPYDPDFRMNERRLPYLEPQESGLPVISMSALEKRYSDRIVERLEQFGYDLFLNEATQYKTRPYPVMRDGDDRRERNRRYGLPAGSVQDDFVLSYGDELEIIFRGQQDNQSIYKIASDGLLIVPDLPPITASGRTIEQIRKILQSYVSERYNTDVYVSLNSVRQIDVLIVGHVKKPGRQTLTVFHTILDALIESGGVHKTGSLRQIKLVRQGRSTIIDLYGLLMHGSTHMDLSLRDGDRIIVPPIGSTVAISGAVNRAGIYELRPGYKGASPYLNNDTQRLTLNEMLDVSGGITAPGQNRFMNLTLTPQGKERVSEVFDADDPVFTNGSILIVAQSDQMRAGTVELSGHTRRPGLHDIDQAQTLGALLDHPSVFGPDIYPLIGVIERWNQEELATHYYAFPPLRVLKGAYDKRLQENDVVHLFSHQQILNLQNDDTVDQSAIPVGSHPDSDETKITDTVLKAFLKERFVFVRGAVRHEGSYPVADDVSLKSAIAVAGGVALEANTKNVEVTSARVGEGHQSHGRSGIRRISVDFTQTDPETVLLEAGDTIRINQRFKKIKSKTVSISGEVHQSGDYDLMPGDRLSDLLKRAGGLTAQAYPKGTIFSRESARREEEMKFRAQARDLEAAIAASLDLKDEDDQPDAAQIEMVREIVRELNNVQAVGRITVESDPGVLAIDPELDILLEAGDRIHVPARPLTVRVRGEVLSPATLQFRADKDARDYVAEAGSYTFYADKKRTFVLYPDGSAEPLMVNVWNHKQVFIPPGSTIIVPRDPEPLGFVQTAKDLSQILSNLAITGIFLDDISND